MKSKMLLPDNGQTNKAFVCHEMCDASNEVILSPSSVNVLSNVNDIVPESSSDRTYTHHTSINIDDEKTLATSTEKNPSHLVTESFTLNEGSTTH